MLHGKEYNLAIPGKNRLQGKDTNPQKHPRDDRQATRKDVQGRDGGTSMKEGDTVIQKTTWMSSRNGLVFTVKKITKTGKIRLNDGRLFSKDGYRKEPGWGNMFLVERA